MVATALKLHATTRPITNVLKQILKLTSSFFFFALLSSPSTSPPAFRFPSCADFCDCRNSAIKSGQSRLSSGSHVLSSLQHKIIIDASVLLTLGWNRTKRQLQDSLGEAFPLEKILYSPFHHSSVQHLFHHIFFLFFLLFRHIIWLLFFLSWCHLGGLCWVRQTVDQPESHP